MINNQVQTLIVRHLTLLEAVHKTSNRILEAAKAKDVDTVANESENKDRMVNILIQLQNHIEDSISIAPLPRNLGDLVNSWQTDMINWVKKIDEIDQVTVNLLESQKAETSQEIAAIYQSKEKHKGYDLNSVKK